MTKNPSKYYAGIDSGGTHCKITLTDNNPHIIAVSDFPSLHYSQHGTNKTSRKIAGNLIKFLNNNKLDISCLNGICVGIAGARDKKDRDVLKNTLIKLLKFKNIKVETDTKIALYGTFRGRDGIILISGTGSIIYGLVNKKIYRTGGWGKILGDYGSGYYIGMEALKEVVKEYDRNAKECLLSLRLKEEFGLSQDNILAKIYRENFPIQNIAPLVLKCAEDNDKISKDIINLAVSKLSEQLKHFIILSKVKTQIELGLVGSMVENENIFSRRLKSDIRKNFRKIKLNNKVISPSFGAVLLAKKYFK